MAFQDYNDIDYLKEHKEETSRLWYNLLKFLEDDDGKYNATIRNSDADKPFSFIEEKADLSEDFFREIYSDMTAALQPWTYLPISIDISDLSRWKNYPWNESVAQLIQEFYFTLDPKGVKTNEDGWLVETEDGFIDEEWLKAGIKVAGRTNMRVLDIKNADAGNSFVSESEMYDYLDYLTEFTVTINAVYRGTSELQKRFTNPYSYKINKKEMLENSPLSYPQFFNMEKGKDDALSSDYIGIKKCLESGVGSYGWKVSDFKIKLAELPEYVLESVTGDSPLDDSSITDSFYLKGTISCDIIKIKTVANPWVIPWYNMDGVTYRTIRGEDIKKSVMKWGSNEQEDYGKYFLDFTHKHNTSSDYYNWARLLMPQSKRRVEVEDLNRNFWVIGQTIAAITAYLLDPNGPYSLMIGGLLNEIMQIWENILMMWGEIAMQAESSPDIAVEFVYVDGSDLVRQDELYYDNIEAIINDAEDYIEIAEKSGDNVYVGPDRYPYMTNGKIRHLKKNIALERAVAKQLQQYHRKKYAEQSAVLIPLLRLNNYEENHYSRLICLGYYKYQKNYKVYEERYRYLDEDPDYSYVNSLETHDELTNIYFGDAYNLTLDQPQPWIETYLSRHQESFLAFTLRYKREAGQTICDISSSAPVWYELDHSIGMIDGEFSDFAPYISGIFEYDSESSYDGVNYYEFANKVSTPNKEPVYGIIMPKYSANAYDNGRGIQVELGLDLYDLARYYLNAQSLINERAGQLIEGYENYNIYSVRYNSFGNLFLDHYGGMNVLGDIRRTRTPEENKVFTQQSPKIKEFGYYLGDLISNKQASKRIIYNLKAYGERELRPTPYPDTGEYLQYYGQNLNGLSEEKRKCIQDDMENDKQALTKFLEHAYAWWESGNTTDIFWTGALTGKFEGGPDKDNIVSYSVNGDWTQRAPVIKHRNEVQESLENTTIKWEDCEAWQKDCQTVLSIPNDGGTMTSSTLLFVDGSRAVNFQPDVGGEALGLDYISSDGLLHHRYRHTANDRAHTGAALRMPIPGEEPQYIYYPNHTSPSGPVSGYNNNFGVSDYWTWRIDSGSEASPFKENVVDGTTGKVVLSDGVYDSGYRDQTLSFKNGEIYYERFPSETVISSSGGHHYDQYLILRKEGDTEVTPDNWRVCHVMTGYVDGLKYAEVSNRQLSKYLPGNVGKEVWISAPSTENIFSLVFRKYILKKFKELGFTTTESLEGIRLKDLYAYKGETAKHDLHLNTLLFGWLKIKIDGEEYFFICNYDSPWDYTNEDGETIAIIEKVRQKIYSNELSEDELWTFIEASPENHWGDNGKPDKPDLTDKSANYYHMGYFNGHYTDLRHSSLAKEDYWYEDRIIDRNFEVSTLLQQEVLATTSSSSAKWAKAVGNILYFGLTHAVPSAELTIYNFSPTLEKYINPMYGTFAGDAKVTISNDSGQSFEINDVVLFISSLNILQNIFVYGPESSDDEYPLYARRAIYRYSLIPGENAQIDTDKLNTWPARPSEASQQAGNSTNWVDDYDKTGHTVDELRDGYEIIYVIGGSDNNYELYKTNRTADLDALRKNKVPESMAQNDDGDFLEVKNRQKWSDEDA